METSDSNFKTAIEGSRLIPLILGMLVFLSCMFYFSGFAYAVIVGGKTIGYVKQQDEADKAIKEANDYMKKTYGLDTMTKKKVEYERARPPKGQIMDKDQCMSAFLNSLDFKTHAACIYIDGKQTVALKDKVAADETVAYVMAKLSGGAENAEFKQKIEIKEEDVSPGNVIPLGKARNMLLKSDRMDSYTIRQGDTLWDIAAANGTSADKLLALNNNISETDMKPGDSILLDKPQPLVTVVTREPVAFNMPIPFGVQTIRDDRMPMKNVKVKQQGSIGKKRVKVEIVKENGVKVAKNLLQEDIISQPVTKIVRVGTNRQVATGMFSYPVAGVLTSRFGQRWGRAHTGVDMGVPCGTSVRAADGGRVIFAGSCGGYGNLVRIDHGNGYITYYGHLSRIKVSCGDKVGKGDVIALSGNTGHTTGPHLHFEVRKNGAPQNPLKYLNR